MLKNQIDSLVSGDIENDNNNSLETLDVIDNANKNVKYKKLSIPYCPICDSIQHEVKQKINLHNQEDYQTVVDKKIINNPEKEIEFLKADITTKNEIT